MSVEWECFYLLAHKEFFMEFGEVVKKPTAHGPRMIAFLAFFFILFIFLRFTTILRRMYQVRFFVA